ncbi:MAG: hypothetical protein HY427_02920 [Candidatus Levybacteria bacterium]|nr:hypothetical protein [Candidatus Levybacteria bacterium]
MTKQEFDSSRVAREPFMRIRRATPQEEQFGRDLHFLHENMNAWVDELGSKWVAVYREERIAVAENIKELLDQVEAQGAPKNMVVFDQLNLVA